MADQIATRPAELLPEVIEKVIVEGDLSKLSTAQRLEFYKARCAAANLDPRCRPFEYISLQGKLTLYAKKECAEQLNGMHGISHRVLSKGFDKDTGLYEVMVEASRQDGRKTEEIGIVFCQGKKADDLANAMMKAMTKAKRRATLSLCGLGDVVDETEIETISDRRPCSPTGEPLAIDNGGDKSGRKSGKYASDEQTKVWLDAVANYVEKRNLQWLDRWTGKEVNGLKDLCNIWQADNHLIKWAISVGLLNPASVPESGAKNAQIGRFTAIIYHGEKKDRNALVKELARYIDDQERMANEAIARKHPELFDEPGADDEPVADDEFEQGEAREE